MRISTITYICGVLVIAVGGVFEYREKIAQLKLQESERWTDADDSAMGTLHDAYSERPGDVPASPAASRNGLAETDIADNASNRD